MRLKFAKKTFFKKKDKKCLFPAGFDKILANLINIVQMYLEI